MSFWKLGHQITGHKLSHSKIVGLRQFKSFFGTTPEICEILWDLLTPQLPNGSHKKYLLWALFFLKRYDPEDISKSLFHADQKTIRKWTWIFVNMIADLEIIIWENRKQRSAPNQRCFVSLDGVDFKILEPKPFNKKFFSHKFHAAGLRYEIGLSIRTGKIVWWNGPYPCGDYPDLKIAYQSYIKNVDNGELTMADKGYKNRQYFVYPNAENGEKHKLIMSRHETVNKRMKQFSVLSNTFRHDIKKHQECFAAVLNITELSIENGQPLFDVL